MMINGNGDEDRDGDNYFPLPTHLPRSDLRLCNLPSTVTKLSIYSSENPCDSQELSHSPGPYTGGVRGGSNEPPFWLVSMLVYTCIKSKLTFVRACTRIDL